MRGLGFALTRFNAWARENDDDAPVRSVHGIGVSIGQVFTAEVAGDGGYSTGCGCLSCAMSEKMAKIETSGNDNAPTGRFVDTLGPQFLGDDIGDNTSSTTTIAVGGSLASSIQSSGDLDYIRVTLVAGQTYTFSLAGGTISDAYLELRTTAGALVAENDDGGILLNSFLMYRPTTSGDYFIVARGFDASVTGSYTLNVNTVPTGNTSPTSFTDNGIAPFSWDEAAIQITRTGASWASSFGASTVVTYSYRSTAPATMPDDTAGFSRFSAAQIAATEAALAAWAAVANITFVRVNDGDGYSNNAAIVFGNYSSGADGAAAFAYLPSSGATASSSAQGDVWINVTLSYNANPVMGDYGPQVLLHEIGHALGLSHPADYNAGTGNPAYGTDAIYYQDTRMFTTMSYFGSINTGGNLSGYASLPQLHDIAAIQRLYGANLATRTGDTIYGFNSNTGVPEYTLTLSTQGAVFAVWDAGGTDTLDLSGYSTASTIDLRQEAYSSAGPANGTAGIFNISIARGAVIENAVGGGGDDTIIGNSSNNRITGNAGADNITGGAGIDTSVYSGASTGALWTRNPNGSWTVTAGVNGFDTLTGVEILDFSDRDVVLDNARQNFVGDGTSDILWRNATTTGVSVWQMSGATQTSASIVGGAPGEWAILGTADISGDGRDDIIWRNATTTAVAVWADGQGGQASIITGAPNEWQLSGLGDVNFDGRDDFVWRNTTTGAVAVWVMNGSTISTQSIISAAPLSWSIVGVADFNGDGSDEILFRNSDGTLARWTTNGVTQTGASIIANVPTQWSVAGTGDFDGDGRADILWRNTADGAVAIWRMDGNTQLGAGIAGGAPLSWSIENVGDYNGDGRDDILWRNTDGTVALWTMSGFTVLNAAIVGVVPTEWELI
ncbi:MAG: M10 family metallopeptidase C-terminal domain-containing protein [Hyphomonadaceae bacterium]|nr:M10 family metallopeptidase C-terminal domain-containing protein [Hyphomonadaceae bacterium]